MALFSRIAQGFMRLTDLGISARMDSEGECTLRSGTKPYMAAEVVLLPIVIPKLVQLF